MGTPDFSVPALQHIADHDDLHICLVVTQPDRPKGRGKKLSPSPVKNAAIRLGIEVFQPENINDKSAIKKLLSFHPDFFVVAAFGQILSREVLDIPKFYPINIHASLLPRYRGASPIQAAVLNMDKTTGITTMIMAEKMDSGDILMSDSIPIKKDDTAIDIHDSLKVMGAELIVKTIHGILDNRIEPVPQDHTKASYVKLLKKKDGLIDWHLENQQILAHIHAMLPWPGAFTRLGEKTIKIYEARTSELSTSHEPGTVFQCDKTGIYVAAGHGSLIILELMGPSGKRLKAGQFLCGNRIDPLTKFNPA